MSASLVTVTCKCDGCGKEGVPGEEVSVLLIGMPLRYGPAYDEDGNEFVAFGADFDWDDDRTYCNGCMRALLAFMESRRALA